MKTYPFVANLKQDYSNYTTQDFQVWEILFNRQMKILNELASSEFIEAVEKIGFNSKEIPDFEKTNRLLHQMTGWELVVVDGIIGNVDFFGLLAEKKFPASTWLRKIDQLDYIAEPDMFHDVFGHAPLLSNSTFSNFFEAFGKLGKKYLNNEENLNLLGRLYWFTVEFGLINKSGNTKIYGAGIISSFSECKYSVGTEPTHLDYSVSEIFKTEYDPTRIQDKYFIISDFEQLYNSLTQVENLLEQVKESPFNTV